MFHYLYVYVYVCGKNALLFDFLPSCESIQTYSKVDFYIV